MSVYVSIIHILFIGLVPLNLFRNGPTRYSSATPSWTNGIDQFVNRSSSWCCESARRWGTFGRSINSCFVGGPCKFAPWHSSFWLRGGFYVPQRHELILHSFRHELIRWYEKPLLEPFIARSLIGQSKNRNNFSSFGNVKSLVEASSSRHPSWSMFLVSTSSGINTGGRRHMTCAPIFQIQMQQLQYWASHYLRCWPSLRSGSLLGMKPSVQRASFGGSSRRTRNPTSSSLWRCVLTCPRCFVSF